MSDIHAAAQAIIASAQGRKNSADEIAKTKDDNLDDPKHQHPNPQQDPGWHQDAQGVWHHPDFAETA